MEKIKKANKLTLILAILLLIAAVVIVVIGFTANRVSEDPVKSMYDPNYAIGKNSETIYADEVVELPVVEIPLKLVSLNYPEDLADKLFVETKEDDTGAELRFSGKFSGKELELFSFDLAQSNDTDGFILGTIKDAQKGSFFVIMHVGEISPNGWSEAEYAEICALQERVNDIIVQFYNDPRFEPSR